MCLISFTLLLISFSYIWSQLIYIYMWMVYGKCVVLRTMSFLRAVMIGASENGEIKVVQLTTDLKPSVPSKFVMLGIKRFL